MPLILQFATLHQYDLGKLGITVPVALGSAPEAVKFDAKLDTGSTHCIFQRQHGEHLGFDIETGSLERFSTAIGTFPAYGHETTLTVLGIKTAALVFFAADEHFTRNVLGRVGWLNRVRLGLIDYEGLLYLSDYNDPA